MGSLNRRIAASQDAVGRLEDALPRIHDDLARDGLIQRFEFSFEATWKAARAARVERRGMDVAGPKAVIRACREVGVLDDTQARDALSMTDDRNATSHTYSEDFARALAARIPSHAELLRKWSDGVAALR